MSNDQPHETGPGVATIDSWAEDTNINNDGVTHDSTLTINVTGETGGTAKLYAGGVELTASYTSDEAVAGSGSYQITTSDPGDGFAGDLTVTITDAAGNESAPSAPVTVSVDTAAPAAPSLTVADDTGVVDTNNPVLLTNDVSLTVTVVSAEPGDLRLYDDGTLVPEVSQ